MRFTVPALAVFAVTLLSAALAFAQENVTYENVTVEVPTLPNVTPAVRPEALVTVEDFNGTAFTARYVCFYYVDPQLCPVLVLRVYAGEQVVRELAYAVNVTSDCRGGICSYYLTVGLPEQLDVIDVVYELRYPDNTSRSYMLRLSRERELSPALRLLSTGILLGVFLGMILHENPYTVALGAFTVPLIVYILSRIGLVKLDFFLVNAAILLAVILFFLTRGSGR